VPGTEGLELYASTVGDHWEPQEPQESFEVLIDPSQQAGVWANFARVSHSPYEFTLDFVRLDFAQKPPKGIVVSRVSLSPLLVSQLIRVLNENWEIYKKGPLQEEVRDRGFGTADD
jgi:hypothetical protein